MKKSLLYIFLFPLIVNAQNLLQRSYGDSSDVTPHRLVSLLNNRFAILGQKGNAANLLVIDSLGLPIWSKSFPRDYISTTQGTSILISADSGFLLTINVFKHNSVDNACLLKTDSLGNIVWKKCYQSDDNHGILFNEIIKTSDEGYAIVGVQNDPPNACIVKLDSSYNIQWSRSYSETASGQSIKQTSDGKFIIAGKSEHINLQVRSQVFILKTDSIGNSLWTKTYGGPLDDIANHIIVSSDNNYYLTGKMSDSINNNEINFILKTDDSGNIIWNRGIPHQSFTGGAKIVETPENHLLITGYLNIYQLEGRQNLFLIKMDSTGSLIWEKMYGGFGWDEGKDILVHNNSYWILGYNSEFTYGNVGTLLIQTDTAGNNPCNQIPVTFPIVELLVQTDSANSLLQPGIHLISDTINQITSDTISYNACDCFPPTAHFTVQVQDSVLLTIGSTHTFWISDYFWEFGNGDTISGTNGLGYTMPWPAINYACLTVSNDCGSSTFCDSINLNALAIKNPDNILMINVYPNPFNEKTTITLAKNSFANPNLYIFDSFNRMVLKIENISSNEILIERNNLTAGFYILKLEINGTTASKKLIIID